MFKKVLVGLDGQEGDCEAINLAEMLVDPGGELTLGYIYSGDSQLWRGSSPPYELAEHERSERLLKRAREKAGVSAQLRWHAATSVGRGLHELVEAIGADLLVVGSSPRALLHRVLVGDHVRQALNGAPCAVAIAPAGFGRRVLVREIGIGYDGSLESEYALAVARELSRRHGAKLSAFQAVNVPAYLAHGRSAADGTALSDLVKQARERIAGLGGVEAHAAYGDPAEELGLYGASLDLLVIGSRGYGPVGRLLHGSTAAALARSARCPLLVLPRTLAAAAEEAAAEDGVREPEVFTAA